MSGSAAHDAPSGLAAALGAVDAALDCVTQLRGRPAMMCYGRIDDDAVREIYDHLCISEGASLDLVLTTTGGGMAAAMRLALMLRHSAVRLSVLVPLRARSAGTLVCLAADEVVMTSLAELGPIDAIMAASSGSSNASTISAEDIRAFRRLATSWFGVPGDAAGIELLGLLSHSIFPGSLAQLYRYDALARRAAARLLEQRAEPPAPDAIAEIVDRLVAGYDAHDYPIMRGEAREIGLPVVDSSPGLSSALIAIHDATQTATRVGGAQMGADIARLIRTSGCSNPNRGDQ